MELTVAILVTIASFCATNFPKDNQEQQACVEEMFVCFDRVHDYKKCELEYHE